MTIVQYKAKDQGNGSYRLRVDPARRAEEFAFVATTARCMFCPDIFHGTAAEAVVWSKAHRETSHPHVRSVTQKQRTQAAKANRALFYQAGLYA